MRAEARASRFGFLLALLVVLVAVSTPAGTGHPYGGHGSPALGASVHAASPGYDESHDRPRGSVTAGHASTTPAPDTWWAVDQRPPGGYALNARGPAGDLDRAATSTAASTSQPSRAPPHVS